MCFCARGQADGDNPCLLVVCLEASNARKVSCASAAQLLPDRGATRAGVWLVRPPDRRVGLVSRSARGPPVTTILSRRLAPAVTARLAECRRRNSRRALFLHFCIIPALHPRQLCKFAGSSSYSSGSSSSLTANGSIVDLVPDARFSVISGVRPGSTVAHPPPQHHYYQPHLGTHDPLHGVYYYQSQPNLAAAAAAAAATGKQKIHVHYAESKQRLSYFSAKQSTTCVDGGIFTVIVHKPRVSYRRAFRNGPSLAPISCRRIADFRRIEGRKFLVH